jgi:hypothetical protein
MSATIDIYYRIIRSFVDTDKSDGLIVLNQYDNVVQIFIVATILRIVVIRMLLLW